MKDIYISKKKQASEEISLDFLEEPSAPPPDPENKNSKKKNSISKVIIAVFCALFLFSFVFIFTFVSLSGYTQSDLEKNQYISSAELKSSPFVTNILLIGVDADISESPRSDTMILLSIDFAHRRFKLSSFLRDSWVEIPSKGHKAKLNSACSSGGPQLLIDTLEYNYGVDISHYVMVDFNIFTQIIDRLGGIEVEVTEYEAEYINRTTRQTVESGKNVHLNGEETLVYCRIRKLDTDFMRTYRQRKVIGAIINKVRNTNPISIIKALNNVFPLVRTDMSPIEITGLSYKVLTGLVFFGTKQTRIPIDEHMEADTINGQWVEVVDIGAAKEYLQDFIYTNKIKT